MKIVSFNWFQHHGLFDLFTYLFIYWRDIIFQKNELAVLNVPFWCRDLMGLQVSRRNSRHPDSFPFVLFMKANFLTLLYVIVLSSI